MRLFKRKKYYYLFEFNKAPWLVRADSMDEAVDKVFWSWFLGGSKASITYKISNDPEALQGEYKLEHNRSFLNGRVKATKL